MDRETLHIVLENVQNVIVFYFLYVNAVYVYLLVCTILLLFRDYKEIEVQNLEFFLKSETLPSIAIIVAAYNESNSIVYCIQNLRRLSYRSKYLIIVNDGSNDNTLEILKSVYQLYRVPQFAPEVIQTQKVKGYYRSNNCSNLIVIDKENGGKADSINAGINASEQDYFMALDADTLLDNTELNKMIRYLMTKPDVIGIGATIRVVNGCEVADNGIKKTKFPKNIWAGIQVIEYLRAFIIGRWGWNYLDGALIISGAMGVFNTEKVKAIGGYDPHTVAEDMELIIHLKKDAYEKKTNPQTAFIPEPVAWTEVPEDMKSLAKQRERWHLGGIATLWTYRKMFLNPKYGVTGMITVPFFVIGETFGPVMELIGWIIIILDAIYFDLLSSYFFYLFIALSIGFGFLFNLFSIMLEVIIFRKYTSFKEIIRMLWCCFLENIGYRQFNMWWKLKAFWKYFFVKQKWNVVQKKGFARFD